MLNWILWLPFVGVIAILCIPKGKENVIRWTALISTLVTMVFCAVLYCKFDRSLGGMQSQFEIIAPWIPSFNINYFLSVDGISALMIILTGMLFVICIGCSWKIEKMVKGYFALFLFLEFTVMGVFMSLDFFLFYVFWEVMLLPMFFLIGIWGGENREYAAVKFFLYTFFGSILMLVGIVGLYYMSAEVPSIGAHTFDILDLSGGKFSDMTVNLFGSEWNFSHVFFWAMFIGFAIKVPVFPFHTWLPHAHVQAPTAVSVILAGVLLKMGTYGFLRIAYPIFPQAANHFADWIAVLGLINVIYGALCAMAQTDLKRLVAYSSVSHMGFVMLGFAAMTTAGMNGAVLQMFNHGTSAAMMFLMVGVVYERSHHRWIVKPDGSLGFGGLYQQMPKYAIVFIISMFASLGLPGLSGFISEALIFIGIYKAYTTITVLALFGLLIGAAYLLWMFKRMFFGEVNEDCKSYSDMNTRELVYMAPLCILVILFGIWPAPLLDFMRASVGNLVTLLGNY
ncbi:MAG: NADH-quinone oxidoreductase subunit M [Halobacteriovoraceae bacterium]|nr:NADH-quinone oxidoreductase subunit M [Halobacteriovoraceae bacterium]MBT5093122.1 NADH-quinone oxidoreductase subunit M [Halobacteriovoraceae bacterium]